MKKRVLQCLCPLPALLYLCFFLPIWGDHRFYPGGWDTGLVFGGMAFLFVVGVAVCSAKSGRLCAELCRKRLGEIDDFSAG